MASVLPRASCPAATLFQPASGLTMTNLDDMARVSENGIDVRYFSTVEKAASWLTARPAAKA